MITGQWVDAPKDLRENQEFYDEVGKCAESIGETVRCTAMGTKTTHTSEILFGRNGWIYSTAIEPTTDEQWDCLRASLEPEYDHVDHIYRPNQFAWSLGLMAVEQLGPRGKDHTSTDSFGDEVVETRTPGQLIVHGPVLYVANQFRTIESARTDAERLMLPIFVKHHRFAGQREYRFVIWADKEPSEHVVDLKISWRNVGFDRGEVAAASGPTPRTATQRMATQSRPSHPMWAKTRIENPGIKNRWTPRWIGPGLGFSS